MEGDEHLRCWFCDKHRREVKVIIAAKKLPTPCICDECIGLCVEIVAADEEARRLIKEGESE